MNQMVKTPIQVFGSEGRYATALYSAATKQKQLDSVEKELVQIQAAMKKNPSLREVISSPIINKKIMATTLSEASKSLSFSSSTANLLSLLAENGKLKKIDGIINSFRSIMAAHRGEVVCEVVTAKPLEGGQRKQLEEVLRVSVLLPPAKSFLSKALYNLQKFVKAKETIQLTARVDPALIGGMVVSIGDKYVDMSIASKIKKYTAIISTTA